LSGKFQSKTSSPISSPTFHSIKKYSSVTRSPSNKANGATHQLYARFPTGSLLACPTGAEFFELPIVFSLLAPRLACRPTGSQVVFANTATAWAFEKAWPPTGRVGEGTPTSDSRGWLAPFDDSEHGFSHCD